MVLCADASGYPVYHITSVHYVGGVLNYDALESAINSVLSRHEVLRTRIRQELGEPVLFVSDAKLRISIIPLDGSLTVEDEQVRRLIDAEHRRPFNLAEDLMLRATLLRLSEKEHILILCVHHIAFDASSRRILFREIAEFYECSLIGRQPRLSALTIQYADYARGQKQRLRGKTLHRQIDYWKRQIGDGSAVVELHGDRPTPSRRQYSGSRESFRLEGRLRADLNALSSRKTQPCS